MYSPLKYDHLAQFSSTEGYWSTEECVHIVEDILSYTKAKTMLEIGFNIGYSASTWLRSGIEHLVILDIGRHSDTLSAIRATALHYKPKKVQWWIGDSTSAQARDLDLPDIELAFIDGEHSYKAALSDSYLSMHYGARWLVYDDVIEFHSNGIDQAIRELEASDTIRVVKRYPMTWVGQGDVVVCEVVQ
jgi:predicted O-methyltransferase YrrM